MNVISSQTFPSRCHCASSAVFLPQTKVVAGPLLPPRVVEGSPADTRRGTWLYGSCRRRLCWQPALARRSWSRRRLEGAGSRRSERRRWFLPSVSLRPPRVCADSSVKCWAGLPPKVEVTSSRSFLFVFLFPEFHRFHCNKGWAWSCAAFFFFLLLFGPRR